MNIHNTQQFEVELEGRLISSAVAVFVFALTQWLPIESLHWPVSILVLSMSIDLIRAAWRKHLLEPGIVVHHLATIIVSMTYLCVFQGVPLVDIGTLGLLGMEITNPFLHGAWIFAKHPLQKDFLQSKLIKTALTLCAIVLWPIQRIWPSVAFAKVLIFEFNSTLILDIAKVMVASLAYLQISWFIKLLKLVTSTK